MRIKNHPILEFNKEHTIPFFYNDKKIQGFEGESIAAALHAAGEKTLSHSLRYNRSRGFFCGIGKCSSCFMTVDGIPNVRTCITPIKKNMKINIQEKTGGLTTTAFPSLPKQTLHESFIIVGCGPAGMMAALSAAEQGVMVHIFDENHRAGGQLIKQTHKFFGSHEEKAGTRGVSIAEELLQQIQDNPNIILHTNTTVVSYFPGIQKKHRLLAVERQTIGEQLIDIHCDTILFSCGALENMLPFPGNDLPGVYGAGGVQTLMNVYGIKPGKKVVMVGAGNVGLIVSYQLLQAGVDVACVIEALPTIGGYHVHAAKLRRCGVPIYTSHTIKEAYGTSCVQGAILVKLDSSFQNIADTEQDISCDTICLAVGLTPSIRLLDQAGASTRFIPEAGGYIALHDQHMQTSIPGIFVAGDSSGIEEASTAMIEGMLAGVSAAKLIGCDTNVADIQKQCQETLKRFRSGPFGEKPRICKETIACCLEKGGMTRY